jgi:protein-S-isoprenylcysteine O-methyltransferase Ste14
MAQVNFILACILFAMITLGSTQVFRVADSGAARGRILIGTLAVPGAGYALYSLWTPNSRAWATLGTTGLLVYGLVMFMSAFVANRKRPLNFVFSVQQPKHLVMHGPYRYVRHPFYSSYCAAWSAAFLGTLNPLLGSLAALMIAIYAFAARSEEDAFARSAQSEEYSAYRRATGMLMPSIKSSLARIW